MATKNLQSKLDGMLATGIEEVKALGIDLYDIIPQVRITTNKRRIGSAQDMNRAIVKFAGISRITPGKTPLFRISIAESECSKDYDIKNTLYHEILHCAPNCQDHQATWKKHAASVNAAYGLNITTTKNVSSGDGGSAGKAKSSDVKAHIGKCFRDNTRTFKFTGFNGRPKNSCDIVDVKTGKAFVCPPAYIAKMMEESPCLFGATVSTKAPAMPPRTGRSFSELIGKKVKNGPRGRKVFTVVSIDPNGGSKAVQLEDERGQAYFGSIGAASRLVVVG